MNRILFLLLLFFAFRATDAAITYVLDGGSGSGTSWSDALDDIPASITRGDTVYIGDGNYGPHSFNDAEVDTERIVIMKATSLIGGHGTDVGWNDSMGNGVASFSYSILVEDSVVFTFSKGYYTIDGVTGADSTGYGIKIFNGWQAVFISSSNVANYVKFTNVEMEGDGWLSCKKAERGINFAGTAHFFTLQNCYIHDFNALLIDITGDASNVLIEKCYLIRSGSGCAESHSAMLWIWGCGEETDAIIRNNVFQDMSDVGGTGYISLGYLYKGTSKGYKIYGNVFRSTSSQEGPSRLVGVNHDPQVRGVKFYHNTMVGLNNNANRLYFTSNIDNDNEAFNNLWIDGEKDATFTGIIAADNSINEFTEAIFVDAANGDYRLANSLNIGCENLGGEYSIDPDGNVRGKDGVVEPGAYEYNSGVNYDTANIDLKLGE